MSEVTLERPELKRKVMGPIKERERVAILLVRL